MDSSKQGHVQPGHIVDSPSKQGHKCCGCCCDTRRAVIIVNLVNIVLLMIGMIVLIVAHNKVSPDDYSDDKVKSQVQTFENVPLAALIAIPIVLMLCCVAGIVGANKYNIYLVGSAAVAYCVVFIMDLIAVNIVGAIIAALFAYPHFVFIHEVRRGIMSNETYHIEEQSCCCV
jgi:uncharacterized membrane protein YecN with MAPEG domain